MGLFSELFILFIVTIAINDSIAKSYVGSDYLDFEDKIIGGQPVSIQKYPSSVQVYNLGSLCAGSIINSWGILTAAHCFDHNSNTNDMTVHVGARYINDYTATEYEVSYVVVHEDYSKVMHFSCDVAVIFLKKPILLGKFAKKAIIVNTDEWMNEKETFVVTGWGWTQYGGPVSLLGFMRTSLEYVTLKQCSKLHNLSLSHDMFCLYGNGEKDSCKGDSGGGVLWKGFLVGIVSHGDRCAMKNKPSVYTNVWFFKSWIEKIIALFPETYCKKGNHNVTFEDRTRLKLGAIPVQLLN